MRRPGRGTGDSDVGRMLDTVEARDDLQARLFGSTDPAVREWTSGSHYVSGAQLVAAGLAELLEI